MIAILGWSQWWGWVWYMQWPVQWPYTGVQWLYCTAGGEEVHHHHHQALQSARESRPDNRSPPPAASSLFIRWSSSQWRTAWHVTRDSWHIFYYNQILILQSELVTSLVDLTLCWPAWLHWETERLREWLTLRRWLMLMLRPCCESVSEWVIISLVRLCLETGGGGDSPAWLPEEVILLLQVFLSSSHWILSSQLPLDWLIFQLLNQIICFFPQYLIVCRSALVCNREHFSNLRKSFVSHQ